MTTSTAAQLSKAELIFAQRMLPHFMAGKSAMEAAQAVLDDDWRLLSAVADTSHSYLGFNDQSHYFEDKPARGLRSELSARLYDALRAA